MLILILDHTHHGFICFLFVLCTVPSLQESCGIAREQERNMNPAQIIIRIEKLLLCEVCGLAFSSKASLQSHHNFHDRGALPTRKQFKDKIIDGNYHSVKCAEESTKKYLTEEEN